ncbi:hypothetical protein BDV18DRAFT_146587 [Aspergillus unguis]
MPSSHVGTGGSLSELIANLSSLLEHAVNISGELPGPHYSCLSPNPPLYTLSSSLLNALLADQSSSLSSPDQISSFIGQYGDNLVQTLETTSLQCLAIYLLRLSTNHCIELGLRLLMDEPVYLSPSDVLPSQLNVPTAESILSSIHMKLVHEAYKVFTNEAGHARPRRMAGKVLAELVYDCSENCQSLGEIPENDGLRPVIAALISMLSDPDIVLMFLANAILRAIYHTGISDDSSQESNGLLSYIKKQVETQGDGLEQFCSYVRTERQLSRKSRGRSQDNGNSGALPPCCIVECDGTYANGLPNGPALLIFGVGELHFIHCSKDTSGWKADYMAIQLSGSEKSICTFSHGSEAKRSTVSLHIRGDDSVTVNDRIREVQTIKLAIAHGDDLIEIMQNFGTTGIQCPAKRNRENSTRPRSSSIVIPLDVYEETIPRLSQEPAMPNQIATIPTSTSVCQMNESTNIREHPEGPPELSSGQDPQSSLTELTVGEASSPHLINPMSSVKEQRIASTTECSKKASSKCPSRSNPPIGARTFSQSEDATSEDVPARNTRSRSKLRENSLHKRKELKPIPPNTQESLIFPRHRAKGKSYTAPSKTIVDWDEDLRASEGSVEPVSKTGGELTSISSPLSDCAPSVFKHKPKMRREGSAQRSSAQKKPASKARKRPKAGGKGKRKTQRCTNGQIKLSSPPVVIDTTCQSRQSADVSGGDSEHHAEISKLLSDNGQSERSVPTNNSSCILSRPTMLSDAQSMGLNNQGRGQTVADKLIAALQGSGTTERRHDKSRKIQHRAMEYEVEFHGSTQMPAELVPNQLHTKNLGRRYPVHNMQDVQPSSRPKRSHGVLTGDEIRSDVSLCANQRNPAQCREKQGGALGGKEAESRAEGERGTKTARRACSLGTTSSVRPQSTESTPESYYSSPSPTEHSRTFLDNVGKATSTGKVYAFGLAEPLSKEHGQSIVSVNKSPYCTDYTSEGIVFREYNSWINRDDDGAVSRTASAQEDCAVDDEGHLGDALDHSSNTIVDRNGSPRLKQRAGTINSGHVVPKRRDATSMVQPRSSKRTRGMCQEDNDHGNLYSSDMNLANDIHGQNKDDSLMIGRVNSVEWRNYSPGAFGQETGGQLSTNFSASHNTTNRERRTSFQYQLRRPLIASGSKLSGPDTQREQFRTYEKMGQSSVEQTHAGGKQSLERTESRSKVSFELPTVAGQIDWQTSLQELNKGMERTLISNSEVSLVYSISQTPSPRTNKP